MVAKFKTKVTNPTSFKPRTMVAELAAMTAASTKIKRMADAVRIGFSMRSENSGLKLFDKHPN